MRCQVWQMLTGAAHDPQLAEAYRLLISKVHMYTKHIIGLTCTCI